MKSPLIILYFGICASVCQAQVPHTTTQLISTANGSEKTASGTYSWSIGEIATQTLQNKSKSTFITQGQQQPKIIVYDIVVYNGITIGDNNSQNNVFTIKDIEKYPQNKLIVLNRWGEVVYQTEAYNNTWEGKDQNGSYLETGTYYYVFYPSTTTSKIAKGQMLIVRP